MDRSRLTSSVKEEAHRLGFDPVGIGPAEPPGHWEFFLSWLDGGFAGRMDYLRKNLRRRADPREIVPGARSMLCVGMNYGQLSEQTGRSDTPTGKISQYARGDDYHDVMKERLRSLLDHIRTLSPDADGRVYVDTGPVLERDFAARAGIGWFGKHTNLIHPSRGSYFFLGEIILTVELDFDSPTPDHCGTCTLCMEACPTDAIPAPYELNSNRCISYLTIELRESIPRELRTSVGDWVYGCDVCQDVCPWNEKHATPSSEPAYRARKGLEAPELVELLSMDAQAFSERFRGSPIKRTKRRGLLRNAAVALGNVGGVNEVPVLSRTLAEEDEPLVRMHVAWALGRIGGSEAWEALVAALGAETEASVREEISVAIDEIEQRTEVATT